MSGLGSQSQVFSKYTRISWSVALFFNMSPVAVMTSLHMSQGSDFTVGLFHTVCRQCFTAPQSAAVFTFRHHTAEPRVHSLRPRAGLARAVPRRLTRRKSVYMALGGPRRTVALARRPWPLLTESSGSVAERADFREGTDKRLSGDRRA